MQSVNPAARRILDLGETAVGTPFRDAPATAPALADLIHEALKEASPIVRRTVSLGGGKPQHLGVTVSPIAGADGALQAAVCLFTDLTAVVELEEQLRLKEALARLGELTAGLAHEFRNGLATIHGYGRLLDPASLPDQARDLRRGHSRRNHRARRGGHELPEVRAPEQLTMAPVDLRAVIARAIEDVPGAAAPSTSKATSPTVDGDEVLLRQAFSNLFRNSLEACAAGGVAPRMSVRGDVIGSDVHVMVEDNGPGFAPEALTKVFQPFATTKATGTGLGLAIVQKVIVSHNGLITAGNRPEGGAQFRIRLPLAPR